MWNYTSSYAPLPCRLGSAIRLVRPVACALVQLDTPTFGSNSIIELHVLCVGTICRHVLKQVVNVGIRETTINVDCKGAQGRYVFIQAPGPARILRPVAFTVYEFPSAYALRQTDSVKVCYGVCEP